MIGQKKLLERIDRMIEAGFPRYVIIVGGRHSGKRLIASYIANKLQAQLVVSDIKVDSVRETIALAYKQSEPTVYLLPDTDKMSIAGKNALLKITEEPPRKAYFIMTLEDLGNTLETLKSRGTVLSIDPYKPSELLEYADLKNYEYSEQEGHIIAEVCTTTGEVDIFLQYNIQEFFDFANTIIDNIGRVNGANAFKIGNRFHYKEEDGGWDISLMFRTIMYLCKERMIQSPDIRWVQVISITSNYLSQLKVTGINKSSTVDMWILQMRGVLYEDN